MSVINGNRGASLASLADAVTEVGDISCDQVSAWVMWDAHSEHGSAKSVLGVVSENA
jgi:hypothetical protein